MASEDIYHFFIDIQFSCKAHSNCVSDCVTGKTYPIALSMHAEGRIKNLPVLLPGGGDTLILRFYPIESISFLNVMISSDKDLELIAPGMFSEFSELPSDAPLQDAPLSGLSLDNLLSDLAHHLKSEVEAIGDKSRKPESGGQG